MRLERICSAYYLTRVLANIIYFPSSLRYKIFIKYVESLNGAYLYQNSFHENHRVRTSRWDISNKFQIRTYQLSNENQL